MTSSASDEGSIIKGSIIVETIEATNLESFSRLLKLSFKSVLINYSPNQSINYNYESANN